MTAGAKGPVLVQDVHLLDKLAHFDRIETRPQDFQTYIGDKSFPLISILLRKLRISLAAKAVRVADLSPG
jgi:hypothetical protein